MHFSKDREKAGKHWLALRSDMSQLEGTSVSRLELVATLARRRVSGFLIPLRGDMTSS
jgi:hypothetical protein